jgi:hypothetical protein
MQSSFLATPRPPAALMRRSVAVLLLALCVAGTAPATDAQQWLQRATVIANIDEGQAPRAFLDTVATRLRKRDTLTVRRTPDGERLTAQALSDSLLEEGLGLQSANRILIQYQFEVIDNEFVEQIQSVEFIYRPTAQNDTDVPILYLDAERPLVARIMRSSGIPNEQNLSTIHYFVNELSFPALSLDQNVRVVSVGGEALRGEFDQRRRVLMRRLKQFIYDRDKVYSTKLVGDN